MLFGWICVCAGIRCELRVLRSGYGCFWVFMVCGWVGLYLVGMDFRA